MKYRYEFESSRGEWVEAEADFVDRCDCGHEVHTHVHEVRLISVTPAEGSTTSIYLPTLVIEAEQEAYAQLELEYAS